MTVCPCGGPARISGSSLLYAQSPRQSRRLYLVALHLEALPVLAQLLVYQVVMLRIIIERLGNLRRRHVKISRRLFWIEMVGAHRRHHLAHGHTPTPQPELTPPGMRTRFKVLIDDHFD